MGAVNFNRLTAGEGYMFVGPTQAMVDEDILTSKLDSTYNVGSTQEGIMIGWEPDMIDIEVDQFGDAARIIQAKQKITIKTTLAEATLSNLALAWGYATGVGAASAGLRSGYLVNATTGVSQGTLNLGIHSVYPTERYVRVEGSAPGSTADSRVYRTFKNRRCIQFAASELGLQRTDITKYSVEFRALPDTAQTGAEYGTVVDSTVNPLA